MVEARTTDKMSQGTADAGRTLSVIIPVYNEEAVLETLFQRLEDIAANLDMAVEFLFVNDGSRDCSMELLLDFHHRDVRCKIVEFSRNFGHQAALSAGLAEATGDCAVLIDADLQDPPELITELLEKWRSGYDVVYAIRRNRKENFLKRMAYAGFYRLFALLADIEMPLDSGGLLLARPCGHRSVERNARAGTFPAGPAHLGRLSSDRRPLRTGCPVGGEIEIQLPNALRVGQRWHFHLLIGTPAPGQLSWGAGRRRCGGDPGLGATSEAARR